MVTDDDESLLSLLRLMMSKFLLGFCIIDVHC